MSKLPAIKKPATAAPTGRSPRTLAKPGSPGGTSTTGSPKTARSTGPLSVTAALQRDEGIAREAIEDDERRGQLYVSAALQGFVLDRVKQSTVRTDENVRQVGVILDDHTRHNISVDDAFRVTQNEVASLKALMSGFIDRTTSTERARLHQLELECNHLRKTLDNTQLELERVAAENLALRDTLVRKLSRSESEEEALRDEVRAEIKKADVKWAELMASLHRRIDEAVLNFHKPQFESALQSLKETSEAVRKKVEAQSERLHITVDCIAARDEVIEAKTMHSNLSAVYRKELQKYSKEQLLNLVDVLSFEQGVTAAVGRSIFASDKSRTQEVFK